jgi:acyl carrier protein
MTETKEDIENKIIAIISNVTGVSKEKITLESTFESLSINSIDGVEILIEVEKRFNIIIADEEALTIKKVRLMIEYVETALNNK